MTDAQPRKQLRVEVEVPGTPQQVWDAIATGPGVTSWFVPAEIDPREGGDYVTVHGDGDDMRATETITAYDPPHRLVAESSEGDDGPVFATEWLVEAQSGGTCIIRLVATVDGEGDWDDYLDSMDRGWRGYFANLRLYLTHFAGKTASTVLISGSHPNTPREAYADVNAALGFATTRPATGDTVTSSNGAPPLAGVVELAEEDYAILRLHEPAPALALVGAYGRGAPSMIVVHLYVFDETADVDSIQATWRSWTDEHFPRRVSA